MLLVSWEFDLIRRRCTTMSHLNLLTEAPELCSQPSISVLFGKDLHRYPNFCYRKTHTCIVLFCCVSGDAGSRHTYYLRYSSCEYIFEAPVSTTSGHKLKEVILC